MECKVEGCGGKATRKRLCEKHYKRVRRGHGIEGLQPRASPEERLWRSIDKRGPDECWPWKKKLSAYGYGALSTGAKNGHKVVYAHRAMWELHNGPIPDSDDYHGAVIMHSCDNRACCNPAHLRLGTQAENVADMQAKGRKVNKPMPGIENGMAKMNEEIVRRLRAGLVTPQQVAEVLGCTPEAAQMAKSGKTWKHVT
ncbi:HNH nuclease [uncultured Caudovirales phage]|uniref:HNH nuclease n=1 Tax=uncultured Caudovirales phage TaxID=2100421 RepID=A0A6J5M2I4_9CAUD|nr:HNH nuclease [uncultured Caudovirales phage]